MNEDKNCLTCKHEPEWGEWSQGEYPRVAAKCRHPLIGQKLKVPAVFNYHSKSIIRYSDDSGIHHNCQTWEPK
jgi:hypothetical protein